MASMDWSQGMDDRLRLGVPWCFIWTNPDDFQLIHAHANDDALVFPNHKLHFRFHFGDNSPTTKWLFYHQWRWPKVFSGSDWSVPDTTGYSSLHPLLSSVGFEYISQPAAGLACGCPYPHPNELLQRQAFSQSGFQLPSYPGWDLLLVRKLWGRTAHPPWANDASREQFQADESTPTRESVERIEWEPVPHLCERKTPGLKAARRSLEQTRYTGLGTLIHEDRQLHDHEVSVLKVAVDLDTSEEEQKQNDIRWPQQLLKNPLQSGFGFASTAWLALWTSAGSADSRSFASTQPRLTCAQAAGGFEGVFHIIETSVECARRPSTTLAGPATRLVHWFDGAQFNSLMGANVRLDGEKWNAFLKFSTDNFRLAGSFHAVVPFTTGLSVGAEALYSLNHRDFNMALGVRQLWLRDSRTHFSWFPFARALNSLWTLVGHGDLASMHTDQPSQPKGEADDVEAEGSAHKELYSTASQLVNFADLNTQSSGVLRTALSCSLSTMGLIHTAFSTFLTPDLRVLCKMRFNLTNRTGSLALAGQYWMLPGVVWRAYYSLMQGVGGSVDLLTRDGGRFSFTVFWDWFWEDRGLIIRGQESRVPSVGILYVSSRDEPGPFDWLFHVFSDVEVKKPTN